MGHLQVHRTLQDKSCADINISKIFQAAVQNKADQAASVLAIINGDTPSKYREVLFPVQRHITFSEERGVPGKRRD